MGREESEANAGGEVQARWPTEVIARVHALSQELFEVRRAAAAASEDTRDPLPSRAEGLVPSDALQTASAFTAALEARVAAVRPARPLRVVTVRSLHADSPA